MTSVPLKPRSDSDSAVAVQRGRRKKLTFDRVSFFLVFLGLPVLIYLIFVVSPFVQAIYYSLTSWSGFSSVFKFIGLENYVKIFQDDIFVKALVNNVILALIVPIVTVVIALVFSTMVTIGGPSRGQIRGLKGSSFYRVVSFFPYVIPAIAIGLIWAQVYTPNGGLLNGILGIFGIPGWNWLGEASTAMGASIFVIVWGLVGFYMVLFIAAIKGVPAEIYEAARIDGAGRFRIAVSITIPLIRDNVQTSFIYMGILALDAFVYMAALNPGGGPDNSTWVMAQQLFEVAFKKGNFGLACAMAVIAALLTLCFAGLVFLVNRLTGGSKDTSY
ncbi:carbohydrate ABC transporter permease [Psychromicrobium sp. YIM B11713]|uniref:carbohydrate ABC transporter permease n=1 Tax=Psychromicrobium sp. YIM B11713 TaxID=3145233 RepID=UPI00374E3F7C